MDGEIQSRILWVRCEECGNEMNADMNDCVCESCGALAWSEPYEETE